MTTTLAPILQHLRTRLSLHNHTALPIKSQYAIYTGLDATSNSLHLGNLAVLITALRFAQNKHKTFILLGGATTLIGDPSFRTTKRDQINNVNDNLQALKGQCERLFDNCEKLHGIQRPLIVNNADFYKDLNVMQFIKSMGQLRMSSLLSRDSVKSRLADNGMSLQEFMYQLLQGYDFNQLNARYGVTLQLGGSDQWGNMLCGTELNSDLHAITIPLLLGADGKKLSKSTGGSGWRLDATPYEFYQSLLAIKDTDISNLLLRLTFKQAADVEHLMQLHEKNPERRIAQRQLAKSLTEMVHGPTACSAAEALTIFLFGEGTAPSIDLHTLRQHPNFVKVAEDQLPLNLVKILQKLFSRSEAQKLIESGNISLNGKVIRSKYVEDSSILAVSAIVEPSDSQIGIIKINKSQHIILEFDKS